jgi:hypothetical protein
MSNAFYQTLKLKDPSYQADLLRRFPKPQDLIEDLFLRATVDAYHRIKIESVVKNMVENDIRNLFIKDFKIDNSPLNEYIQNKTITLTSENQANTKNLVQRTDIEFHSNIHQIQFVIECKRLSSAETRYVQGAVKNGKYEIDGLEKFLHLNYAENDNIAAMVGFVVNGNVVNITGGLKEKIMIFEPASNMNTHIDMKCIGWDNSFQSVHLKKDNTDLLIYHLFFDFSK